MKRDNRAIVPRASHLHPFHGKHGEEALVQIEDYREVADRE
jgi:hypothetical protein